MSPPIWDDPVSSHAIADPQSTHPAPLRGRVALFALVFGVVGAPLAWNAQLLIAITMTSHACYPARTPLAAPIWSELWPIELVVSVVGIGIGISAAVVSLRSWRRTRDEKPGSGHDLLSIGDGRTRFLAMCGMLTSALFLVALAFATVTLFLSPLCNG